MDTDTLPTKKETLPSVDESTKESQIQDKTIKKRKRQICDITNPFFRPFTVTLHPHTTSKSHTFVPIAHLPRADLPLIWLDHASNRLSIPPGALFSAQVEKVHCNALSNHASTLVARLAPNGGLYAVERAGKGLYISCALQPWVTESRVIGQSLGTVSDANDLQCLLDHQEEIIASKNHAVTSKPRTPRKPMDRRGALARMSILPAKEVETVRYLQPPELQNAPLTVERPLACDPLLPGVDKASTSPMLHQQFEEVDLDHLRVQYLEALYLSKTSLAYLAKGPLARARTQAQGADDSVRAKLLDFYRESIISTKKLDLKYKDSVNRVIESAKSRHMTDVSNEHQDNLQSGEKSKKKLSRKRKMGKDALYPCEEGYIHRFWAERELGNVKSYSAELQAQEQRKLVSDLRTRETKMQILLILEVLALEASCPPGKDTTLNTDTLIEIVESVDDIAMVLAKTPTKLKAEPKKKIKDYSSDLDTLIDKLCIWHTVGIDDMFESPEKEDQETRRSSSGKKDQLRDFCADVIIPFYASRLPEQCKMICRKLGGPEVSPNRPKATLSKTASASRLPPGAVLKQRPRALQRKTLERVLSDDRSMRHVSPPTFSRSSTAPLVPNLKREPSENCSRPASRGALQKSVSFSNREIDLDADARVQIAKRRKLARMAEQKKELDAAITALKKPNRTVAAQGLMDEIESRSLDSNLRKQVVHIAATPRRSKSRSSNRYEPTVSSTIEPDVSTEDQVIPASTVRPRGGSDHQPSFPQVSAKKRAVLFTVHETPARLSFAPHEALSRPVSRLNFSSTLNDNAISSDPTLVDSTPATSRLRPDLLTYVENTPMRVSNSMRPVLFTPLKKTEVRVEEAFRDAPIIPATAGKAMDRVMGGSGTTEMSVYDALGWNDDYDI